MGFFSLIEFSHDQFDEVQRDPAGFVKMLTYFVNTGDHQAAQGLTGFTSGGVRPVAMRHSSDKYVISSQTLGFPAQLPYHEAKDEKDQLQSEAITTALLLMGEDKPKRLTIAKLMDCVTRLFQYNIPYLNAVKAMKEADHRATENLSNPNWKPTRAHYEQLRNALRNAHKNVEP
jgi:hypothetical protein